MLSMHPLRLTVLAMLCLSLAPVHAADNSLLNRENQLKAAYLFHFAELAEWPEGSDIAICLRGDNALGHYLPALQGRRIAGRTVNVKLLDQGNMEDCQILFLGADQQLTEAIVDQARREHILLVGDSENFAHSGGMLQFSLRDNKLKLLVNLPAVRAAELKLSSKLLRMAEILE